MIALLGGWLALFTAFVAGIALLAAAPNTRAVLLMSVGLVVLWVGLGGFLMRRFRDPIRAVVQAMRIDWRIKLILFATLLAMLEEAITTGMTNLAPWFGVPLGAAYITASANYWDVICLHSVVVFIPMFAAWAFLLQRYAFRPSAVLLLFGMTGMVSETIFGGAQAMIQFAMWIFVYGLMLYLPAYCLPVERGAQKPRWWHYILAVFLPILAAIPVALIVSSLHPISIHFPPILPGS